MKLFITLAIFYIGSHIHQTDSWGFYAHKKINRMACFTLPSELFGFYKTNIDYITIHAVDPDKRRYALKNEFSRHYIDIDHWDTIPFPNIPRSYDEACMKYGKLIRVSDEDSIVLNIQDSLSLDFYHSCLKSDRYSPVVELDKACISDYLKESPTDFPEDYYIFDNQIVKYGILPYFLETYYKRLVWAFKENNIKAILKLSADIGHYIADAHVPLHTTVNYNGQLTNQDGLHAFWESRLPELFADSDYDFIVGKAEYIDNLQEKVWQIITESHELLKEVLSQEKALQISFSKDKQFCFEERLGRIVETQCSEYAYAYHEKLNGMVEKRMRDAILAVGSFWYTAWIDAGQPRLIKNETLNLMPDEEERSKLEQTYLKRNIIGRKHN